MIDIGLLRDLLSAPIIIWLQYLIDVLFRFIDL